MSDEILGVSELHQRIPFLLSQLGADIAGDFAGRLHPTGIAPRNFAVVMALANRDGQSQRELAVSLGIHRNAMVTAIDTLESQGLVTRQPHPSDRRAFAVTLTDRAKKLMPSLDEQGRALENEVTAPLSAAERAALLDALQRISAHRGLLPGVHPGLTIERSEQ